ncbi:MAG: enoyl-CoA hydratase-related protein, partial [Candidatus Binatia bacterium]
LNNPAQYNSYTTEMVKAAILGFRAASNARDVVAVVCTGAGDRAFCTGGNTKEYAEYYAGRPHEYRQYMRLFNDMVSAILGCDKPVIARVNGMRIGGGQEIGMACDFSVAQDLARFGQAGPKHGSAAIGGSTDFLPVMIGAEMAMNSGILCESFSAHEAMRLGLLTDIVPALKVDGEFVPNPLVETQMVTDAWGRIAHGKPKTGAALAEGKALLKSGEIDLSLLDARVEEAIRREKELADQAKTVTEAFAALDKKFAELELREADLSAQMDGLDEERSELEARDGAVTSASADLAGREAELEARAESLAAKEAEVKDRVREVKVAEARVGRREKVLEHALGDLSAAEKALKKQDHAVARSRTSFVSCSARSKILSEKVSDTRSRSRT